MKQRIHFFIQYFLFWFIYFVLTKIIFLTYHFSLSKELPISDWLLILLHGSRLDLSATGYLLLIPGLMLMFSSFFSGKNLKYFINFYTYIFIILTAFFIVVDMELYRHWGFRMDCTPLKYITTPNEVMASINLSTLFIQLFIGFLIAFFSIKIYNRKIAKKIGGFPISNWKTALTLLLITGILILPIRGSLGIAPINAGFVYFHKKNVFANHAAINVVWNIGNSIRDLKKIKAIKFFKKEKSEQLFKDLYKSEEKTHKVLKTNRPNIIIVILESYTAKIIEPLDGLNKITPNFNKLCKEGILFENFYANGDRTDKGIVSVISSYPAQPKTSIIKMPKKSQKLPFLTKYLQKLDYETQFLYGGNIDFANFRSYFSNSQVDKIITKNDFPKKAQGSKWGVHDHLVFGKLLVECNLSNKPFFKIMLSQSSHEPFEVPMKTVIEGNDEENKFLNSAYYTDKYLGEFVKKAKNSKWWNNTLVIFVADHGARNPHNTPSYVSKKFHIPMLWIGGALNCKDITISTFASQTDIAPTLMAQLKNKTDKYKFGKNIFSKNCPSFSFFDYNNGFGYINENFELLFDNNSKKYFKKKGKFTQKDLETGKAYLQEITQDFKNK